MLDRNEVETRQHEADEAQAERVWENQALERAERLDQEIERVMAEIDKGEHDDELANSPFVDSLRTMRVARQRAMQCRFAVYTSVADLGAIRDLNLQIRAYAEDLAERRMLR